MAWWISLMLLSMAALLWKKSCDSMDDVIALLQRILATTLVLVVVLVSRNLLWRRGVDRRGSVVLCRGGRISQGFLTFTSRIEILQELGKVAASRHG